MRIGIDLGGTKTEVIALDGEGGTLLREREPSASDYAGTVEQVAGLVEGVEARLKSSGTVGVGIPGAISPGTGRVKNANSTWLTGHPFDRDLADRLGRDVRVMNDANCFALSEATDGAGAGERMVFGVILGTGVGGGLVLDGRVVEGAGRLAGEWGHNPLPWPREDELPGPMCYCGRRGCIEVFCSGPGMERDHARVAGIDPAGRRDGAGGPSAAAIAEAARRGDPEAGATLDRYVDRLSRSLATVVDILDPDVVVLGGGVSNVPDLPRRVEEALPAWVFGGEVATRVVRNRHGDSSGVRGAAWLWPG